MFKACLAIIGAMALWSVLMPRAHAEEAWETFTMPPPLPPAQMEGRVAHDGARIWFATYGSGPPVVLLHGYGGDADTFGFQVPALIADGRRVIVIDSRGQGRSTRDARPFSYELMETDVIAVMDALGLRKADIVGWSDGAILGLIVAMKNPDRARRIFAFSPNTDPSGLRSDFLSKPIVPKILAWMKADYERLSPTPGDFNRLLAAASTDFKTIPNYSAQDLGRIRGPAIAIVDGDHEEFIYPEHTRYVAHAIPGARLIILPGVSHAAPVQKPDAFNKAMIAFLDAR